MEQSTTTTTTMPTEVQKPADPTIKLVDVPVGDDNVAFNLLIQFVNMAQKRGAYSIDESAKIWECVKRFQRA